MDSLSQIVLGAAVGEAALGKKVGKAILWGAIAGTFRHGCAFTFFVDEITATQWHRGFSHSFCLRFVCSIGLDSEKDPQRLEKCHLKAGLGCFFGFAHHPLLDAQTTWEQLFWPLEYKLAFQNIFVIDPLYTLPF